MTRNMSRADRYLRSIVAASIFVLWGTGLIGGAFAWVLGAFAAIFLATSFIGFCPLYAIFHFSTLGTPHRTA